MLPPEGRAEDAMRSGPDHRKRTGLLLFLAVAAVILIASLPRAAVAQPQRWTMLAFTARGVDANTTATFGDLLRGELQRRLGAQFVAAPQIGVSCAEPGCARVAGTAVSASFAVYGSISTLGSSLVVMVTVVDVQRGVVANSQKMSVSRIEELEVVSERMAVAIAEGTDVRATARLGNLTERETRPTLRRALTHNIHLRLGAIVPFGSGYAGSPGGGMLFDLSYWLEATHFAIEPRIGLRFDAVRGPSSYYELPIDIGAYFIVGRSDISFFAGGGLGAHHIWETRGLVATIGEVLPSRTEHSSSDSGWGFGSFGRVGILLARTYAVRVTLSVEYNITVVSLNGGGNPMALTAGAGIIF
jgi:hypothetical protein